MIMDWQSTYAREVLGAPPDWQWCSISTLGSNKQIAEGTATHFQMKGAVPVGVYTRGPRRGHVKWPPDGELDVFIVEFKSFRGWLKQRESDRAEAGE